MVNVALPVPPPGNALLDDGSGVRTGLDFAAERAGGAQLRHVLDTRAGGAATLPERDAAPVHCADQRCEVSSCYNAAGCARRGPVALERHLVGDLLCPGWRDIPAG